MVTADWGLLVYAIYVPLLLSLYALELLAIFKHRKKSLDATFYKIFAVIAIVNIAACLLGSFVFRLNLYPIANQLYAAIAMGSGWLTAAYAGAYYLNSLSEFLGVLLAFNRFTTLYFLSHYERFWRFALFLGIIMCASLALAPVEHLLNDVTVLHKVNKTSVGFIFYYADASVWLNTAVVSVVCNTLSSLLYVACLVRLCSSTTRNYRIERNLFLVGFLTMLLSLPYMSAMLYFYVNIYVGSGRADLQLTAFVAFQLPWLMDLKFLTPAPMLLVTNNSIRTAIWKMLPTVITRWITRGTGALVQIIRRVTTIPSMCIG